MLKVPTIVKESPIHGLGCFAAEAIPAGTVVWQMHWKVDRGLPSYPEKSWEWEHSYRSHRGNGWILPRDNAAWMNFASDPNLREGPVCPLDEPVLVAARDIAAGEELTVGLETDGDAARKVAGGEWRVAGAVEGGL